MFINARNNYKIIDCLNISIIFLILFLTFISFNSQRKWTTFYSSMIDMRYKNNNIFDYISKTEQYLLNEIEHQNNIKKTDPDDLIYVRKIKETKRINFLSLVAQEMIKGFDDGKYQRGY